MRPARRVAALLVVGAVAFGASVAMHYLEYKLIGVYHHAPRYVQTAVHLLSTGKFDGMTLCTEVRPLEALVDSLEDMSRGVGSKYILQP